MRVALKQSDGRDRFDDVLDDLSETSFVENYSKGFLDPAWKQAQCLKTEKF